MVAMALASGTQGRTRPRNAPSPSGRSGLRVAQTFEEFYAAHYQAVAVQIYVAFGDRAEAQDIAQEAFLRALSRRDRLVAGGDPVAWVRRVAWNLAISRWRRLRTAFTFLRRQRDEHVPEPSPDHVALSGALATLPEQQRRAVVLHYLADLSVADIARQEGVAEGTVKSWLHRSRKALALLLRDEAVEGEVRDA
ncbi:RNA polymerase sigma factor [Actinocatenispora rupis]|uniref:RNA polymerase sigma24 factor n=1 Tax=Actinocatenispora rupis TaxID=519421 RepID=A0A8J3N8H3_9ACTN|nr:RNA polymerase sigma24 factor [Actinocatenispora rupis]